MSLPQPNCLQYPQMIFWIGSFLICLYTPLIHCISFLFRYVFAHFTNDRTSTGQLMFVMAFCILTEDFGNLNSTVYFFYMFYLPVGNFHRNIYTCYVEDCVKIEYMSNVDHTIYLPESVNVFYTEYVADALSCKWLKSVEISSSDSRFTRYFLKFRYRYRDN
jgi:hypothetical protein